MLQDLKEATEGDFRSPLLLFAVEGFGGVSGVAKAEPSADVAKLRNFGKQGRDARSVRPIIH